MVCLKLAELISIIIVGPMLPMCNYHAQVCGKSFDGYHYRSVKGFHNVQMLTLQAPWLGWNCMQLKSHGDLINSAVSVLLVHHLWKRCTRMMTLHSETIVDSVCVPDNSAPVERMLSERRGLLTKPNRPCMIVSFLQILVFLERNKTSFYFMRFWTQFVTDNRWTRKTLSWHICTIAFFHFHDCLWVENISCFVF